MTQKLREILQSVLLNIKADGLCNLDESCGCGLDDLAPCGNCNLDECEPAKWIKPEDGNPMVLEEFPEGYYSPLKKQAARIQELESSLDEAEALTKKNAELMNGYLGRIAELEDALVEGLTNFLHYRASCYDPARRCPYAKECDDCSTWDACGHVEKFRSEARRRLQAEGKIGPDAKPRSWQITDERVGLLEYCLETLLDAPDIEEIPGPGHSIEVLRAMLTEAGQ